MSEHPSSGGQSHPSAPGSVPGSFAGPPGPALSRTPSRSDPPAGGLPSGAPAGARAATNDPETPPERPHRQGSGASAPAGAPRSKAPSRKRRGSRGGRRRSKKKKPADPAAAEDGAASEPSSPASTGTSGRRRRRRGSGAKAGGESASKAAESPPASDGATTRKRRKRGSRGGRRRKRSSTAVEIEFIPGEENDLPELARADAPSADGPAGRGTRRAKKAASKSRKKAKRRSPARSETSAPAAAPKKRLILVNAAAPEETRVAVVEDGRIAELQMTVKKHVSFVNDIYRGRVVNLEPTIGAAFIDFGQGRNGFLHASDVLTSYSKPDWSLDKLLSTPVEAEDVDEDKAREESESSGGDSSGGASRSKGRGRRNRPRRPRMPIEKLVKKGQMVVVQITKDAIGDKGPTLTTYISIPGRYLVLMPSLERTGVSRKIEDERERRRLKRILSTLDIPDGMGVIVRTAGVGKTKAEIKRDLEYLLLAWEDFAQRLTRGRNPAPLYQESDVAIRTMRDLYTSETAAVIVDDDQVHERVVEFTKKLMPEQIDRIKRHDRPRPLFQSHGVEQDFEKIFARRVELPSGGSIVIDQTEALVAIDVNSGRTREEGADFEDIALKTNLEAVPEIARQIRLRDLGGILVLDYIDMMRASSRRAVEQATREALRSDRARSKVGRISQFGLLELTRQRLGPGLNKLVYDTCQRCRGSGRRRNASSRAHAVLRRLGASLALKGFTSVEVRAHPEVIEYLQRQFHAELARLEESSGRKLVLKAVPDQFEDSVLHYLRADGREVRPGGRRKR